MTEDAFDLLGVRAAFDLNRSEIDRAYLALAASMHPDLAAGNEEAGRQMAAVNRARAMLTNPESRADGLLGRLGGPKAEHEKSLPSGFLMEMMEVREQIEAAMQEVDRGRRRELGQRWIVWAQDERDRAVREVGAMFEALPGDEPARGAALRAIRVRMNAWRYVERLIEQLDPVG